MSTKSLTWQITSPSTIELNDTGSIPQPGPKQALVRIHGVSLNYRDRVIIDKSPLYPLPIAQNLVPGSDGAGIVEEVEPDSSSKIGEHVVIHPNSWLEGEDPRGFKFEDALGGGSNNGTLQRYLVLNDNQLLKAPKGLSLEEASTIYTAGVTAYNALFHGPLNLEPGMTVFSWTVEVGTGHDSANAGDWWRKYTCITGTTLPEWPPLLISFTCCKIAAAVGATMIATSSSDQKLGIAKNLGAKQLINYSKQPDWATKVLEYTNGTGVDVAIDVVGAGSIEQTLQPVRYGGMIPSVGKLSKDADQKVDVMKSILYGAKTGKSEAVIQISCKSVPRVPNQCSSAWHHGSWKQRDDGSFDLLHGEASTAPIH